MHQICFFAQNQPDQARQRHKIVDAMIGNVLAAKSGCGELFGQPAIKRAGIDALDAKRRQTLHQLQQMSFGTTRSVTVQYEYDFHRSLPNTLTYTARLPSHIIFTGNPFNTNAVVNNTIPPNNKFRVGE